MREAFHIEVTAGAAILYPLLYFFDESGWFSALLPGVLLHELAHWITVQMSGGNVTALRVDAAGLCLDMSGVIGRSREMICAAAGPTAGLLWSAAASNIHSDWWQKSAAVSLLLNLFNLLPAVPLDGGRILFSATGSRKAVLCSTSAVVAILLWISLYYRIVGLLIPAGVLLKELLTS